VTAASHALEARAWGFRSARSRVFYLPNGVWPEKYAAWTPDPPHAQIRAQHGLAGKPILLLYTRFAEFPLLWPLDVLSAS